MTDTGTPADLPADPGPVEPEPTGPPAPPAPCGHTNGDHVCVLPLNHADEWHRDADENAWQDTPVADVSALGQVHVPHMTGGVCDGCGNALSDRHHPHPYVNANPDDGRLVCACGMSVFAPQHNITGDVVSAEYRAAQQAEADAVEAPVGGVPAEVAANG